MLAPALAVLVASFVAGHPMALKCDADTNPSPTPPPAGFVVQSWTQVGGSTSHFWPSLCGDMAAKPGTPQFAIGFGALLHEAAVARGVWTENCANERELEFATLALRRFYLPIPTESRSDWLAFKVWKQLRALISAQPSAYQPTPTSCAGMP